MSKTERLEEYPNVVDVRRRHSDGKLLTRIEEIEGVIEDVYTGYCIRKRSNKYTEEKAFKAAVFDLAVAYVDSYEY